MRSVRMIVSLSGGGPGGRDWRDYPADATLTVEDWEAEDLIRIGLAVPDPEGNGEQPAPAAPQAEEPSAPEPAPELAPGTLVSPSSTAAGASAPPAGDQDGAGQAEGATEPAEPDAEPAEAAAGSPVAAPAPSAPKQAWIDYAVSCGASPDEAASMTKADLMSRYGGRL
jgi:hypothetical protein